MENNKDDKKINYSGINLKKIESIVNIEKKDNDSKFEKWFSFHYETSKYEEELLEKLIKKNKLFLPSYNEEKLLISFIAPILFSVDFNFEDIKDWYSSWLQGELNGFKFSGKPDFMVAKGKKTPEKPYFFIQEFKRTQNTSDPEDQLLAEMLVAMEINKTNIFHGAFIIGQNWFFVVVEKLKSGNYEYFVSRQFDSLNIENLRQIYINLQAAKKLFCNIK